MPSRKSHCDFGQPDSDDSLPRSCSLSKKKKAEKKKEFFFFFFFLILQLSLVGNSGRLTWVIIKGYRSGKVSAIPIPASVCSVLG